MNTMKNFIKLAMGVLLIHMLVACAKPPVSGTKKDGKDASMDASSLSAASVAGDHPLTNASGVTIYPGSGSASGSAKSGANDPLSDPNSLLAKRVIYYPTDIDTISEQDKLIVQAHAEYLAEHPRITVRLEGNADERGSGEYNLALGQRRADEIKKILLMGGVKEGQIESVSYGEEKPKGITHDESSWSQNRRTDLIYNVR